MKCNEKATLLKRGRFYTWNVGVGGLSDYEGVAMRNLMKTVLALGIGIAATAQAQQVVLIEGQRDVVDPSALIGEDSGSFHLSRQTEAMPAPGLAPTDARRSALTDALVREDSGAAYFASLPLGPGVDRAVVVADLDQARASGQLAALVSEDSGSAWLAHPQKGVTTVSLGTQASSSQALAVVQGRSN